MSNLLELAERCEKATGSDRELSEDIARALGWTQHTDEDDPVYVRQISTWWKEPWAESWSTCAVPPSYTSSLDAAMTLVPEGGSFALLADTQLTGGEGSACAVNGYGAEAVTPALALCAAALRARAASCDRNPKGEDPQGLRAKHESAVGSEADETP